MSGTGSLMIRNLRKKSDYDKAVLTQNELLNIAIANDANVAQARKEFQQGIIPQALPQTKKSPTELQADLGLQESTAIQNLLQLFKYPEISGIISRLTNDDIFILNQSFPAIKKDIESKFNLDLITPTFFEEYLKKYIEELNESKGISTNLSNMTNKFNQLTTHILDIQKYLPDNRLLQKLVTDLNTLGLPEIQIQPVMDRLKDIEDIMLDKSDFEDLQNKSDVDRDLILQRIQTITTDLPTKTELEQLHQNIINNSLPRDVVLQQLEKLVNSLTDKQIQQMKEVRQDIKTQSKSSSSSSSRFNKSTKQSIIIKKKPKFIKVIDNPKLLPKTGEDLVKISAVKDVGKNNDYLKNLVLYFSYADGIERRTDTAELKNLYEYGDEFKDWCFEVFQKRQVPSIRDMLEYIDTYGYEPKTVGMAGISTSDIVRGLFGSEKEQYEQQQPLILNTRSRAESTTNPTTQADASATVEGFGLPIYKGARPKKSVKIGKGIDMEKEPLYKTFGKFLVSMPNLLNRDILLFKYPSLSRVPKLEPIQVSEDFKDFFLDCLDNGKINHKIFKTLDDEEKTLFEVVAEKAGLFKKFGLSKKTNKDEEEDIRRFNILRGEYYAGNNSHQLLDELRKLIIKFIHNGRINKNEGISILATLV